MTGVRHSAEHVKRDLKLVQIEHALGTKHTPEDLFSLLVEEVGKLSSGEVPEPRVKSRDANVSGIASLVARLDVLEASNQELNDSVHALRMTVRNLNHSQRHYRR